MLWLYCQCAACVPFARSDDAVGEGSLSDQGLPIFVMRETLRKRCRAEATLYLEHS